MKWSDSSAQVYRSILTSSSLLEAAHHRDRFGIVFGISGVVISFTSAFSAFLNAIEDEVCAVRCGLLLASSTAWRSPVPDPEPEPEPEPEPNFWHFSDSRWANEPS